MRCYLSSIATLVGIVFLCAQTPIILEAGPISYTDIDGFVDDAYPLNVEDCSSIIYEVVYNFSLPWVGLDDMDHNLECIAPTCPGDPQDPQAPGCDNCWDFMNIEAQLDGTSVDTETIGTAANLNQFGTYSFGPICTDGATTASIAIRNQNNTTEETNTFSNVTIICWEAVPEMSTSSPICAGQNLILDGIAGNNADVDTWAWTNDGAGTISNVNDPFTDAANAEDGETYTLTTSDNNACTASVQESISAAAAFTAELSGGGTTCINNCTDNTSDIIMGISGGSGSYDVSFTINNGSIPFPFFIPVNDFNQAFRVCVEEGAFPSADASQDPIVITMPPAAFPLTIDIDNIEDDTGCIGMINGGAVTIDIAPQPPVVGPLEDEYCTQANGTIDLTQTDAIINGGDPSLDVIYFTSPDFDDEISDPTNYAFNSNMVCAATYDGICYSDFVCFGIDFDIQPFVSVNVDPIVDCSDEMYSLPPVGTIADVMPVSTFQGYFLDAAATMGPLSMVPNTTTQVFIIANSQGDSCDDLAVPVQLDLTPNPVIDSPGNVLGGCGSVELPTPDGTNINSFEYNTDEDGNGTSYNAGDLIASTDNISTIYLIATSGNGCTDILEITIDITSSVTYSAAIPAVLCDSLVLPAITPTTPTVAYYTMSGGMGMALSPGTVLQAPYNETLYLFDPNQDPSCAAEVPVMIEINPSPTITLPADTTACDFYVLGTVPGTTNTPDYTVAPIDFPSSYRNVGDTIRSDTRMYILDTLGACTLFDSININIVTPPNVGMDTTIIACEGYSSSVLNLVTIIGNPDPGGMWSYPTVPDFIPVDPTQIDISTFPVGSYEFTYAIEDQTCGFNPATITLTVEAPPYAGEAAMIEVCDPSALDFMSLISNPETGGIWSQVPVDTFDFADSTNVDLSSLPTGEYFFLYLIAADATTLCDGNSATLFIDIQNGPNAGDDSNTTACLGSTVNIRDLLSIDADADGMFFPDGFFLSGDEWITNGNTPDQTYNVEYIVESTSMGCPPDTAFIEIFLADNPSAGEAVNNTPPCSGSTVELDTYLQDESPGGQYVLTSDYSTEVDNPFSADTTTEISYIIPSTGGCDADTTDFTVLVVPRPIINYTISGNELCADSGDCIELQINSSAEGEFDIVLTGSDPAESFSFTQNVIDGVPSTVILCAQGDFLSGTTDTINVNGNSSTFELLSSIFIDEQCGLISDTTILETINLFPSYSEIIDTTICAGDSIEVNGQFYSQSIDLNTLTINGCDSLLQIMITNFPEASTEINGIFCEGTPIEVFGNQIIRDTIATYIDIAGSSTGCDSIVNVDVQFQNVAIGILDDVICDGRSITVGTEVFDENRTTDDVLLPGGSVAGCDSLVMVDLTYGVPNAETVAFEVCSGDAPIDINGTLYGPNQLTGTEIIINESGCDSTITINLSLVPAIMVLRDTSVCGTYSEVINGTTYDINNPDGEEMLTTASGCDSIVTIALDFILNIEVTRDEQVCNNYSEVIGNNTYDINNPSGMEMLTTSTGCDSTIIIDFDFVQGIEITRDDVLCSDYSEVINNVTYDISNPSGTEMLMTATGCDSTIIIDFTFVESTVETRDDILCEDDSEVINGITYDINNPTGIDTLRSAAGCDSIITNINFTFTPASATIEVNDICADDTEGTIDITALDGLNLPIMISINGGPVEAFDNVPISLPVAAGPNDISIDDGSCMYQESISVMASTAPTSEILQLVVSPTENQLTLTSDITPQSISWSSDIAGVTFTCLDCPDPNVVSTDSYTATVTYTDDNGCNYSESILIEIAPIEVGELYIPNVFDINLPGENRFFIQTALPPVLIDDMQIFDRWGNKVFEQSNFLSNDSDTGWDGTRDGKILEQGVYLYMIKYNDGSRDNIRTGSITIIR